MSKTKYVIEIRHEHDNSNYTTQTVGEVKLEKILHVLSGVDCTTEREPDLWYVYRDYGHGDTGFVGMSDDPCIVSQMVEEECGWKDYDPRTDDDPPNMSITCVPI